MVFTLLGASGHNSATEPLNKTLLPSPSVQSERTSPVSRKQDGCLDILINKAWKRSSLMRNTHTGQRHRHADVTHVQGKSGPMFHKLSSSHRVKTGPLLPSRLHCRSASGCPGLPIMHHWGHRVSSHTAELPDAGSCLDQHQRGPRGSPPETNKDRNQDTTKYN